jgi:two-component system, NtrC family, nitrogen regulation sensor histidine kinase NtrY
MIFKRFTFLIVIRIFFLLVNVIVISLIFGDRRLFFNQIILALILVIQVIELIRFVNHTNRELTKLFYAIRHSDFSITFRQSILGKSFKDLNESMLGIIDAYKQVKIEKEAQFHFLQMLVNQLHIGIIAMDQAENITLINPTAEEMLGIPLLKNWKLLKIKNPVTAEELETIGINGKKLIEMKTGNETYFVSADVRTLTMLDHPLKLITLQNINSEIEQKEIEAWHKLIRILTHEIMNSVTPISSLTETMQGMLRTKDGREKQLTEMKQETISDIAFSLATIHRRTDGLLNFVEHYRQLTKVPKPVLEKIDLQNYFSNIIRLLNEPLVKSNIHIEFLVNEITDFHADPMLLEQVLINLITNSIHALKETESPRIDLLVYRAENQIIIEVKDNGKGIPKKELSEIFIPFFTTKKEGSGIGLSLSKQIMSLHGGSIRVRSSENIGTSFYLIFNQQR